MGLCLSPLTLLWFGYKAPGIVTGTVLGLRPVRCVTGTVASGLRWLAEPPPGWEPIAGRRARIEARIAAEQQQLQSTGADRADDPDTSAAAGAALPELRFLVGPCRAPSSFVMSGSTAVD